jgi:hypothetical protein
MTSPDKSPWARIGMIKRSLHQMRTDVSVKAIPALLSHEGFLAMQDVLPRF